MFGLEIVFYVLSIIWLIKSIFNWVDREIYKLGHPQEELNTQVVARIPQVENTSYTQQNFYGDITINK